MLPFDGLQGLTFSLSAKLLARTPCVPRFVAWYGRDQKAVRALLRGIGTELGTDDVAAYTRLFGDPAHIRAVLNMMAEWDLHSVRRILPAVAVPTLLLGGAVDTAIPAHHLQRLERALPDAELQVVPDAGHLVHEEVPEAVLAAVDDWVQRRELLR
jgi:magnesium chelatase accessory protein